MDFNEIIARELVAEGTTKKVHCTNYWDFSGVFEPRADTQYDFDRPKKFEIYEEVRACRLYEEIVLPRPYLVLYIEGEPLDVGEISEYKVLKTMLKLDCCIGAD